MNQQQVTKAITEAPAEAPAVGRGTKLCEVVRHPSEHDADLAAVLDAWPRLPEAIRAGILALVRAAGLHRP